MNGYNTGWKFDRWYDADAVLAGAFGVATFNGNTVDRPAFAFQSSSDLITCGNASIAPIMTHGYNSVRIRFLSSANDTATATNYQGVVCWEIYLVESDSEEDQTASLSLVTPLACVATNVVYPSASLTLSNFQGRTGTKFANQVRVVANPGLPTDINSSQDSPNEAYATSYMSNALGLDVQASPSTIDTAGAPSEFVYNRRFRIPALSPGFASDGTTTREAPAQAAGEIYINGLAGAARILVIPMRTYGSRVLPMWNTVDPKGFGLGWAAKKVAIMYNLIQ